MKISEVKKLPVYKTVAQSLSPEDQKEFARMLSRVEDINAYEPDIPSAFVWSDTPQGHDYWEELVDRLDEAGVPGGWHIPG